MRYFNYDSGCSVSNAVLNKKSVVPNDELSISFKITIASSPSEGRVDGDILIHMAPGTVINDRAVVYADGFDFGVIHNAVVAKGKSKTFTVTGNMPDAAQFARMATHIPYGNYLVITILMDNEVSGYYSIVTDVVIMLEEHDDPVIGSYALTDRTPMREVADGSPYEYFGSMLQNASLPSLTFAFALDPVNQNDPSLTANHQLVYTIGGVDTTLTATTGHGVGTVAFNLNALQQIGTVNWVYTITDSYGNTDTETGSFNVIAYSPPAITNLLLERYAVVPDAGGEAHEASDDGTHLWLTLAAGIAAVNSRNAWTAVMTYWDAALGESTAVTVTSQDGWTLGGTDGTAISLARDEAQLAGITADDTKDWRFRLTITDALNNSATLVFDGIVKAGAVLDVSPGGVGVGMRCTGTEGGGELFQCAYPARFAAENITTYTFTKTSGNANVNRILAQRSGSVVNIELRAALTAATSAGSNVIVGTLSGGPLPSIGISTAAGFTSSSTAVLSITPSGEITVRAIAASYGSNGATVYWRFMFLTND